MELEQEILCEDLEKDTPFVVIFIWLFGWSHAIGNSRVFSRCKNGFNVI